MPLQPCKIRPCLWFDKNGSEAAKFYVNLFNTSPNSSSYPTSSIGAKSHYEEGAKQHCQEFEAGTELITIFNLAGQELMALNGGPMFKFTPAVSLMVECADQDEIDHFWTGFTEGVTEREMNCGWCNDQYGLSWQIIPKYMGEVATGSDREKHQRMQIWMMNTLPKKLIIQDLVNAAEGKA